MPKLPIVTVLDDNLGVARSLGPWEELDGRIVLDIIGHHLADDDALVGRVQDSAVLVVMRERTPLDRARLSRLPNLRHVVTKGMHNASIDLEAARAQGVSVSGTPGGPAAPVELTWALILALTRDICGQHRNIREGRWQTHLGRELRDHRLGVVGLGRLGSEVARIGQAFGMDVVAWSPNLTAERGEAAGARAVARDELLATADVVSLHMKLSERTRGIIGAAELARMRSTAYLVNTSRGPLVDESALLVALEAGTIAGAGLDVYDIEPLPADHRLRSAPNVVLTPHLGYVAQDSYARHFEFAVRNISAWLDGSPVRIIG